MARKQVERSLPPLKTLFRAFRKFDDTVSHQSALLETLRGAARKLRGRNTKPFYAMRDVAAHFRVPLRTVAIAYEQLELEGILNRIRGSKTMLVGKSIKPRKAVRAVIGIPLWFQPIVVSPYARMLHWELENRLRRYGFVADIIFFRGDEVSSPEFAARLVQHNLDITIWHTPHPSASQIILSLKDSGVQQIIVQPADNPSSLKLPTYLQDWQIGYKSMAADWRKNGIRTVILSDPVYAPSQKALKSFEATLLAAGLEVFLVKGAAADLRDRALAHPSSSTVVAFLDQVGSDTICNEEPVIVEQILRHCRAAFCRGPLRAPYFQHRKMLADLIRFSAPEVAEKIAHDIRDGTALTSGHVHTFHAIYEPQVPFATEENL